ncbi:MAG: hypothetical protein IPL22_11065 [Bacteroidetes bacterium]|nr:hypothetical protein [Bacteroidota bacterium]
MKNKFLTAVITGTILAISVSCNQQTSNETDSATNTEQTEEKLTGQSGVVDDVSQKNIVESQQVQPITQL